MNVLVAVATKHGATHGIADAIVEEFAKLGIETSVRNLEAVHNLTGYDAAILGSAIYMGHPMPVAQHFVDTHEGLLTAMPVWLFSSGALGTDHPVPAWPSVEFDRMAERIGAREYRMFAGRLDNADLSFGERIATKAVQAPEGDFRDWDAIRHWAQSIARTLSGLEAAPEARGDTVVKQVSPQPGVDDTRQLGVAIGIDWASSPFDVEQLRMGVAVEFEHGARDPQTDVTGDDPVLTAKIAWAHLKEMPDYYTRLAVMEAAGERSAD